MISERKKLMALLDLRQRLEQDYDMSRDESIQQSLDAQLPALLNYFKCDTPEALRSQYPTTLDMRTAAESKRYFAPRTATHAPLRTAEVYNHLRRQGSQEDYLGFVRVSKAVFINLVTSVLSQHAIFKNASNNGQESIEKQVAITLWRMGHHGKEAGIGEASHIFGLSEGTIMKCTQRCMMAFRELSQDVITWPTPGEKKSLKVRMKGIADNAAMEVASSATTIASSSSSSSSSSLSLSSSSSSLSSSSALPSSSFSSRQRGRAANVGISDAVGILSRMNVFLVVRPMVKDTAEYLIPLPESVKDSVKSLPLPPATTTSAPERSGSALPSATTESGSTTVTTEADASGASLAPRRRSKRSKTTQSSNNAEAEDTDTSAPTPKKRVRKSRISPNKNDTTMAENEPAAVQVEATTKRKTRGRDSKASSLEPSQDINTPESTLATTTSTDTASGTANVALETIAETPTQEDGADSPSSTLTAVSTLESSPSSTATASATKKKRGRSHALVRSAYLKRDYGYNVLFVCDSTTRIRFADVTRPASWSDQRVLESSQLLNKAEKLIAEDEYLVAESTFLPGKNIISSYPAPEPTENPKVSTTMEPSIKASDDSATMDHGETTSSETAVKAEPEDDIESQRQFNEIMDHFHKRGQDCQRKLLARFPSLLGLRVQLKDDHSAGASQENARNWMLACMTIHNLVLGDDSSYKLEWETQLEAIQSTIRKQQEQQARLMWKMEHFPSKKEPKPLPPHQQNQGLDMNMDMGTEFPKLKAVPLHQQLQYPTPRRMVHPTMGGANQDATDTEQQTHESTAAAIEQLLRLNDINTSMSSNSMMDGVTGATPVIQGLGTGTTTKTGAGNGTATGTTTKTGAGNGTATGTSTETCDGGKAKEPETPMSTEERAQSLAVGMKRREQICANIRSFPTHSSLSSSVSSSSSRNEPSKCRIRV